MNYTDEQVMRMDALMDELDGRLEAEKRSYTWRDGETLSRLAEVYAAVPLAEYSEPEDFENGSAVAWYLGEAYAAMERYAVAAPYYNAAFLALAAEKVRYPDTEIDPEDAEVLLATAIRARNYYGDDDCENLTAAAKTLLGENYEADGLFACRQGLMHDPVEATPAYLAVIDAVDAALEQNAPRTAVWEQKTGLLAAHGIAWRSPAVLNPDVSFGERT